jgi:hypothetical protein
LVFLSSKVGRERKKESGDSSENGICSCGLPSHCCQPAVAGGIIYVDLRGELSTHLAQQALFAQISPVREPLLQAFPFPSTLGKVTLHPLVRPACLFIVHVGGGSSPLLCSFPPMATFRSFPAPDYWAVLLLLPAPMFVYSSRGKWVFPHLLWSFPPSTTLQAFLLLVAGHAPPLPPEALRPGWLVYLQSREGFPSPNLWRSVCPTLFPTCLYCSYCLLLSFSFCPPGGGWSVQGAMLLWPRLVCGSTAYSEARLVRVFPGRLGTGDWQPGSPSGFSV